MAEKKQPTAVFYYTSSKKPLYMRFLTYFPGKCSIHPPHTQNRLSPPSPLFPLEKRRPACAPFEKGAGLSAFLQSFSLKKTKSAGAFSPLPGALLFFFLSTLQAESKAPLRFFAGVVPFFGYAPHSPGSLRHSARPARPTARGWPPAPGAPRRPKTLPPASARGR